MAEEAPRSRAARIAAHNCKLRNFELPSPPLLTFAEPYQVAMSGNLVAIRWKGNDVSMYEVK